MQPLFECRYTHDEEWANDFFRWMYFRRPILWVCYVLLAAMFAVAVYDGMVWGRLNPLPLICPPILLATAVLFAFSRPRMTMKRQREMYGEPVEITLRVTDEQIVAKQSNGAEYHLNYADIRKVMQTPRYVYVKSKTQLVHSFKKDGFTVGTAADFLEFLRCKGVRVK